MTIVPIEETIDAFRAACGDVHASAFRGDTRLVVPAEKIYDALKLLKEKHGFDLLVDITCVDYLNYPGAKDRFGLVYLLAGTVSNQRLTVRAFVNEPTTSTWCPPAVRSVVGLWEGANWLERESGTCLASISKVIPICGGSSCPKSSPPFHCARTIRCKDLASGTTFRFSHEGKVRRITMKSDICNFYSRLPAPCSRLPAPRSPLPCP